MRKLLLHDGKQWVFRGHDYLMPSRCWYILGSLAVCCLRIQRLRAYVPAKRGARLAKVIREADVEWWTTFHLAMERPRYGHKRIKEFLLGDGSKVRIESFCRWLENGAFRIEPLSKKPSVSFP